MEPTALDRIVAETLLCEVPSPDIPPLEVGNQSTGSFDSFPGDQPFQDNDWFPPLNRVDPKDTAETGAALGLPNGNQVGSNNADSEIPSRTADQPTSENEDTGNQTDKHRNWHVKPYALPPCRVCGAKGTGFHYGVNTCEPCKVKCSNVCLDQHFSLGFFIAFWG